MLGPGLAGAGQRPGTVQAPRGRLSRAGSKRRVHGEQPEPIERLLDRRPSPDHNCRMPTVRFPTITPEALESLRSRIGKAVPRPEPYIEVATRDPIPPGAQGIGERGPFGPALRGGP